MKAREHVRKTGVHFYKIGIGNKDDDTFLPWSSEYTSTNPKTDQDTIFYHGYVKATQM